VYLKGSVARKNYSLLVKAVINYIFFMKIDKPKSTFADVHEAETFDFEKL
jgi:hypothetical protein